MGTKPATPTPTGGLSEVTILARLLGNGREDFPPALARYLLRVGFTTADKARMHELAVNNQEGALTPQEREELDGYAKAACLLGILQSKARKSLNKPPKSGPR